MNNPCSRVGLIIVGLVLIGGSLWFNLWSTKQTAIDALAVDMAWAINNLLNRQLRASTRAELKQWEDDFRIWCANVSSKLENRAFFTRADQLHFDMLGVVLPIGMSANKETDWLFSMLALKFDRLRDVINWTQQRPR
jgi:hypothetical protein